MAIAEILEIMMLISFGFSWPLNILKSIRTRSTKGKSLWFLILIDSGYVCGIIAKVLRFSTTQDKALWVFALCVYILNFTMVSGDMILYFINKRRETLAK